MHRETYPVRSRGTRLYLTRRFYDEHGKPPGAQALQDALGILEAKALFEGEEIPVHVRVAEHDDKIYVDLANDRWEVVEIDRDGWRVMSGPPVRFRRPKGMKPLPHPAQGGGMNALRPFANIKDERDWLLLAAWLVQAFRPTGPYPVLILQGEQGSAKTTLARALRAVVDPSTAPVRTVPRGEHDLVIAASNSRLLALDNLSSLPPWLSDALCRLSTGGGFGTRTLYENDEETIFDATRPVILNGITDIATRADLLDRAILLPLSPIPEAERRAEAELWREFGEALPGILGGIFGAVSCALRELPNVELASRPRMADFAEWATAAEPALGMEPGEFMEAYAGSRREVNRLALEADPVAGAVAKLMEGRNEWVGTAAQLLKELDKRVDEGVRRYKTWPKQPQHLSRHLKRLAPVLRAEGIEVEDLPRKGSERPKRIFKNNPANDRHGRHERHETSEVHTKAASEGDGGDAGVTVPEEKWVDERHGEGPIEPPDSADRDDDDAHDADMQDLSRRGPATLQRAPEHRGLDAAEGYELVTAQAGLVEVMADIEKSPSVGLDLETTGLRWWEDRIRILSITTQSGRTWLVDAFEVDIRPLFPTLEKTKIVAHNAQFDLLFLRRAGFEPGECSCTMILSQILWAGKKVHGRFHDLQTVAKRVLGPDLDKEQQTADWGGDLSPEMLRYAAEDSRVLLPLHDGLCRLIEEAGGMERIVNLEERLLKAVVDMADAGVPIDREAWSAYVELVREEKERLIREMDTHVTELLPEEFRNRNAKQIPEGRGEKINWQSSEQRAWALQSLGFELPPTENGRPSTGKDALKTIDHPLARLMERFNAIRNFAKTFGEALTDRAEDDRLHCDWRQNEAATGRMSCRRPPLQGVPSAGKLREAIKAPSGHKLVVSDLSQVEVRVLAALSGDEALREAFEEGLDIHRSVAERVLGREVTDGERKIAKAIVFGNMYGQGVEGMRRKVENDLGRPFPHEEAEKYWGGFFDAYPSVKLWREEVAREFDLGGRETRTRTGRRRIEVDEKPKRWNTPIQGLAADALKAITVEVHERRAEVPGLELVALVHDEVICVVPEEHAERAAGWLTDVMETAADAVVNGDAPAEARVPMKADTEVRGTWADK